jgi:hypothetical protein
VQTRRYHVSRHCVRGPGRPWAILFLSAARKRRIARWTYGIAHELQRRRAPDTAAKIKAIPQIVGMGNVITHEYDVIDYATVCRAIHESLPILRAQIEALLPEEDLEAQEQTG